MEQLLVSIIAGLPTRLRPRSRGADRRARREHRLRARELGGRTALRLRGGNPGWPPLPLQIQHLSEAARGMGSRSGPPLWHTARVGRRREGENKAQSQTLERRAAVLGPLRWHSQMWGVWASHGRPDVS